MDQAFTITPIRTRTCSDVMVGISRAKGVLLPCVSKGNNGILPCSNITDI